MIVMIHTLIRQLIFCLSMTVEISLHGIYLDSNVSLLILNDFGSIVLQVKFLFDLDFFTRFSIPLLRIRYRLAVNLQWKINLEQL